mmetsp:Transcript_44772/g.142640  ORF Transcript_44772/g.142640 Transcript_44772/m.142640 type:complete len:486 (+) Transcript_44772:545-2002(+)
MHGAIVGGGEAGRHLVIVLCPAPQEAPREGRVAHDVVPRRDLRQHAALVDLHVRVVVDPALQAPIQGHGHDVQVHDHRHVLRRLRLQELRHRAVLPEEEVPVLRAALELVALEHLQLVAVQPREAALALRVQRVALEEVVVAHENDRDAQPLRLEAAASHGARGPGTGALPVAGPDLRGSHDARARGGPAAAAAVDGVGEVLAAVDLRHRLVVVVGHVLDQLDPFRACFRDHVGIVAARPAGIHILVGDQGRLRVERFVQHLGPVTLLRCRQPHPGVRAVEHSLHRGLRPARRVGNRAMALGAGSPAHAHGLHDAAEGRRAAGVRRGAAGALVRDDAHVAQLSVGPPLGDLELVARPVREPHVALLVRPERRDLEAAEPHHHLAVHLLVRLARAAHEHGHGTQAREPQPQGRVRPAAEALVGREAALGELPAGLLHGLARARVGGLEVRPAVRRATGGLDRERRRQGGAARVGPLRQQLPCNGQR